MSFPAVTFCQSTTTTPPKRCGFVGRRTTMRVSYGISPIGFATFGFVALYLVATPRMKYSCSS
jgi:hypothetical protein